LDEHGYSKMVDFWSLGVLLFEMCCGWSPFYAEDTQQMYKNICFGKIRFPRGVINEDGKQFVKGVCLISLSCICPLELNLSLSLSQLLNRNPKHRLGSQRDAAELKEHPFFNPIDWNALARKQVTPPFKPVVESDESVSNFDPEFTNANLNDRGLGVGDFLDDDDPSEEWVSRSVRDNNGVGLSHMPNGPLGSDKDRLTTNGGTGSSQGIEIGRRDGGKKIGINGRGADQNGHGSRGKSRGSSPPLTNSVQENFKGFTYSGEDTGSLISREIGKFRENNEDVVADEETQEPTTEDEVEDDGAPAGRYAKQRWRNADDADDDDF
jgi:serine/threonine protein kinase SCH9